MPWGSWTGGGGGGSGNLLSFQGFYDADTNTPTLTNGIGTQGDYYITSVEGSAGPAGLLVVNQYVAYNGSVWQGGGIATDTDQLVVANSYVAINNQEIAVGQTVTQALGAAQGQINEVVNTNVPISVVASQNVNTAGLKVKIPVTYENIGSSIITLTMVGGSTLRSSTVLNGTSTTAGLNPGETITLTKQSDNTILATF